MQTIIFTLALVMFAGLINGSFATPMKYMVRWEEENIWLVFSIWGFIVLPWLSIFLMMPNVFDVIGSLPADLLLVMICGGVAFGLGQIAFAKAFRCVGIGLAFVINISIGTSGSALIPILWHERIMGTAYSYVQIVGIIIFILAVCAGASAGSDRDRNRSALGVAHDESRVKAIKTGMLILGVVLAFAAGIGSVAEGVSYIWSNPSVSQIAVSGFGLTGLAPAIISWVIIFSAAWIPYFVYFLALNIKRGTFSKLRAPGTGKYWPLTILMGVGFWGSLIFFSRASNEIGGDLAPTVAWPLFMVFIILTSNFWSVKSGEWKNAGAKAARKMAVSIALFIVAIVVFSYSSHLQPRNPATPDDGHHDINYQYIEHDRYPTHELE